MTTERSPIPQTVLDFVGLTQEKLTLFDQERQEIERQKREQLLAEFGTGKEAGIELYRQLKKEEEPPRGYNSQFTVRLPGNIVEIELHWILRTISQAPDEISSKWLAVRVK